MLLRRAFVLGLSAFFAVAGSLHAHAVSPLGGPACAACVLHDAGGSTPEPVALAEPPAVGEAPPPASPAPLCSRPGERLLFETGPPRA